MRLGLGLGFGRQQVDSGITTMANVVDSAIFDLSAQIEASTDDANTLWKNLVPSPADASAQADYDFAYGQTTANTTGNPVLTGTAGADAAYYDVGQKYFTINPLPAFFADVHKTSGGDFWLAFSFKYEQPGGYILFCTNTKTSDSGIRIIITSSDEVILAQRGDTGSGFAITGITLTDNTDYILIWSHDRSANNSTLWINSTTGSDFAHTFNAGTNNSLGAMVLCAAGDYTIPAPTNTQFFAYAGGNSYLTDSQATAIADLMAQRQPEGRYSFL